MVTMISRWDRQQRQLRLQRRSRLFPRKLFSLSLSRSKLLRYLLITLAIIAVLPPLYFHFSLRRFNQIQLRKCSWMRSPPLVCAHGGDSTKAFPNTMDAYNIALSSQVDCIEIDVSRSSDGVLFALHDRDLQRISGNSTSKVGYLSMKEIVDLGSSQQHSLKQDVNIPTIEDALKLVSGSVRQVILDAKVGPPLYEKGLAKDILAVYHVYWNRKWFKSAWVRFTSIVPMTTWWACLSKPHTRKENEANEILPPACLKERLKEPSARTALYGRKVTV